MSTLCILIGISMFLPRRKCAVVNVMRWNRQIYARFSTLPISANLITSSVLSTLLIPSKINIQRPKIHLGVVQRDQKMSKIVSDNDVYYNTVLNYVKKAGELIKERIVASDKKTDTKSSDIDLVTQTDQEVEKLLIDGLSSQFPDHEFIGEETISDGGECNLSDVPTWIIDPIDGTMNFVHGFPHCCISIALFIKQKPEIGIVYNPMMNQLFTAKRGEGAFLNGNPIRVSNQTEMSKALLAVEFGTSRDPQRRRVVLENFKKLSPNVHGFRSLGSAALNLAMVACGAADAYYEFGIHVWDIAAGELLITEAGGVVIDPSGGEIDRMSRRVLAASSTALAEAISKKLMQYYPQPRD